MYTVEQEDMPFEEMPDELESLREELSVLQDEYASLSETHTYLQMQFKYFREMRWTRRFEFLIRGCEIDQ